MNLHKLLGITIYCPECKEKINMEPNGEFDYYLNSEENSTSVELDVCCPNCKKWQYIKV